MSRRWSPHWPDCPYCGSELSHYNSSIILEGGRPGELDTYQVFCTGKGCKFCYTFEAKYLPWLFLYDKSMFASKESFELALRNELENMTEAQLIEQDLKADNVEAYILRKTTRESPEWYGRTNCWVA